MSIEKLKKRLKSKRSIILKWEECEYLLIKLGEISAQESMNMKKAIILKEKEKIAKKELTKESLQEEILDMPCKLGDRLKILRQRHQIDIMTLANLLDIPLYVIIMIEKHEIIKSQRIINTISTKCNVTEYCVIANFKKKK